MLRGGRNEGGKAVAASGIEAPPAARAAVSCEELLELCAAAQALVRMAARPSSPAASSRCSAVRAASDAPPRVRKKPGSQRVGGRAPALRVVVALLSLVWLPWASEAAIPEPSAVVYGQVTRGGAPATSGVVSVKLDGAGGSVLGSGPVGTNGNYAVLVPLYFLFTGESRPAGSARVNDTVEVLVDGQPTSPATKAVVTDRGELLLRNLVGPVMTNPDVDGDGRANAVDNCGGVANANQADLNGNGIGDACEGLARWNPPLRMVLVGNASNAADAATGRGRVTTAFQIGSAEVTNAQYVEFLNAVAKTADGAGLYDAQMGSDPRGGIDRTGTAPNFSYRVKPNLANKPVNFVAWLDAARYVNWLHNGRPTGAQGNATTERGAYDLTIANAATLAARGGAAKYALATEDEWYKAAYYNPANASYSTYPTRQGVDPVKSLSNEIGEVSNPGSNRANHENGAAWGEPLLTGRATAVDGEGTESRSFYGTANQGGNVAEWLGAPVESGLRVARGGSYAGDRILMRTTADKPGATERSQLLKAPTTAAADLGFRIVGLGAALTGDDDQDGIMNGADNCLLESNGASKGVNSQSDVDGDGVGDVCDCDFNNDGICGQPDYTLFLQCFNRLVSAQPACSAYDMNTDGAVGQPDYTLFLRRFNQSPGPSGVRP